MYHSVIGKRLVDCVNHREGTTYSVRDFFDEVYIPLFFGSSRLMQNVNNSPFDQAITKQKKPYSEALKDDCLAAIHKKVRSQPPDASFFLGGPASGTTETTSGQVTSMRVPVGSEDVYASWIGAALGIMVQGGVSLLIEADDVLLATYDGWSRYRRLLDQTPNLKPLQINAWNGQWIANHLRGLDLSQPIYDRDGKALETQPWVQLLFALSYHFREGPNRRLLAYVYSLGQMNETIGFVCLNLPEVRRPVELYRQLFTVPPGLPPAAFEILYETDVGFRSACQSTEIGLRALKPKDVFHADRGVPKAPKVDEAEKQIAFDTYQTWIIAMLNNKELMIRAGELADALNQFGQTGDRGKTTRKQLIDELLSKKNRRDFVGGLTALLEVDSAQIDLFERTVSDILNLSADNVPLFLTLLRFKYAVATARK